MVVGPTSVVVDFAELRSLVEAMLSVDDRREFPQR